MTSDQDARIERSIKLSAWTSTPMILLAAVGYAEFIGTGWSWPLFLWGAALGPVQVFAIRRVLDVGMRVVAFSPEQIRDGRRRSWKRYLPTYISLTGIGIAVGIISASAEDAFADVGFTIMGVLGVLLPLLMLPALARKAKAQGPRPTL